MWSFSRAPDLRLGPATKPYLRRWHLLKTKWFSIYLHNISASDPGDHIHDHPADNLTIVLRGGYVEWRVWGINPHPVEIKRADGGSTAEIAVDAFHAVKSFVTGVHFRRAEEMHHITAVRPNTWTLWVRFKDRREWGFWLAEGFFIPWRDYVSADPGVAREDLSSYLQARFAPRRAAEGPRNPFPPPVVSDQAAFNARRRDVH